MLAARRSALQLSRLPELDSELYGGRKAGPPCTGNKDLVSARTVPMLLSILAYNCVCRKATSDTIGTTCHHYLCFCTGSLIDERFLPLFAGHCAGPFRRGTQGNRPPSSRAQAS